MYYTNFNSPNGELYLTQSAIYFDSSDLGGGGSLAKEEVISNGYLYYPDKNQVQNIDESEWNGVTSKYITYTICRREI